MKVALLSFDLGEYCIHLANGLVKEADTLLLLSEKESAAHVGKLDPAVEFSPFQAPRLRHAVRQLRTSLGLLHKIRAFKPDVIHIQEGQLWFNVLLPFLKPYPLVVTIHDPQLHVGDKESHVMPQWVCDFGYRQGDQIIVHAESLREAVQSRLHIPAENVHVIPHVSLGDGSLETPGPKPLPKPSPAPAPNVLFFGRIWEYKGLEYLIRAEPIISRAIPNVRIVIAGRGEDFGRYQNMMVHPERFCVYNKYISDAQRARLFQQASVVALPYIEASQSGVIPLAYACAKPVVATQVGGLPEFVEHERTGLLVPPRDEHALAEAIIRLLQDQRLCHQLGENARHKIMTECSPAAVASQTVQVYRHALGGTRLAA